MKANALSVASRTPRDRSNGPDGIHIQGTSAKEHAASPYSNAKEMQLNESIKSKAPKNC